MHWYWKYGIENGDFENGFETLQRIQDDYMYMSEQWGSIYVLVINIYK